MELKAGAYYKTRDGRKAFVAAIVPPAPDGITHHLYPVIGNILIGNEWSAVCWTSTGGIWRSSQANGDLIEPWREPRTKEVWAGLVTVQYMHDGMTWATGNSAGDLRQNFGDRLLALKRVTLVEGEFDE